MSNKYWISIVVQLFCVADMETIYRICILEAAWIVVEWHGLNWKGVVVIVCMRFFVIHLNLHLLRVKGYNYTVCVFGSSLQDMPKFKVQNLFVAWKILHRTRFQAMNCFFLLLNQTSKEERKSEHLCKSIASGLSFVFHQHITQNCHRTHVSSDKQMTHFLLCLILSLVRLTFFEN